MIKDKYFDLSHTFEPGMPVPDWPGEIRQEFELIEFKVSVNSGIQNIIKMNLHCGTHVDAPYHYYYNGAKVEELDIDALVGNAYIAYIPKDPLESISANEIEELRKFINKNDMLFISTGWERMWGKKEYESMYPYFEPEAGRVIVSLGIKALGIDTPGPDAPIRSGKRKGDPLHIEILSHGIPIIENLTNLISLANKKVYVYAFPIKIKGASGSPVRVIAKI